VDANTKQIQPEQRDEDREPAAPPGRRIRRVAAASTVGTAIEYYDYFLFGTAAATVFPKLFFPDFSPAAGTLAAFGAFGAGFVARPFGAAVAGHFGDRIGRKAMLVATLLVMGLSTFCIGLLPPFATIGIWAPVLLVMLRLAQGFGVGGELPGAQLMCVEHAEPRRRGFYGSWPQSASPIGLSLSTGAFVVIGGWISNQQFAQWGWRIPFLFSGVLVLVGIFVRLKTDESPEFERARRRQQREVAPLREFIRNNRTAALRGIGMYLGVTVIYYLVTTFLISYAAGTLGMPRSTVLGVMLASQPIFFGICLAGGALSDRIGRRPVYVLGTLGAGVVAFPAFALIDQATTAGLLLGTLLLGGFLFFYAGAQGAYFAEMFDVRVRYTGTSLSIAIATLVGGAFTPAAGTLLVKWYHGGSTGVALLVITIAIIAAASAAAGRETRPARPLAPADNPQSALSAGS
jgi:MHS family shikimate/dehydroshikimate transporter-like MFS transporter